MPASEIAYAGCFVLSFVFLLYQKVDVFEALLISVLTMFSGVYLYEIVYHYMWGISVGAVLGDLSTLNVDLGGPTFPLLLAGVLTFSPLIAWRYVRFNYPLVALVSVSAILVLLWEASGFPQFWCVCSFQTFFWGWLPRNVVEPLGYVFNSVSKVIAVIPAFLFFPRRRLFAGRLRGRSMTDSAS
jgi:hypothetical protein